MVVDVGRHGDMGMGVGRQDGRVAWWQGPGGKGSMEVGSWGQVKGEDKGEGKEGRGYGMPQFRIPVVLLGYL